MIKIKIKPLTINQCWQGKRFKTINYKGYERSLSYLLPKLEVFKGKLILKLKFGFSSKLADIDNPVKPFLDCLQNKYCFNDRDIYKLIVEKEIVKKGEEFIEFNIKKYGTSQK